MLLLLSVNKKREMQFSLEICADSVGSAIIAQESGAQRIELCDSLIEGGVTPSQGKIESARQNLDISLNVLIRPRGGDFLYNGIEYDIMRRDIERCGEAGADGVVLGILTAAGSIDVERTARLIEEARPMTVTFHRAFDMCKDPLKGLSDIIATGADILLTSGQKNDAESGALLISELVRKGGSRIIIMPGGGLNETNIAAVARTTGASEFHLTGRKTIESAMLYRKTGISMGGLNSTDEFKIKAADPDLIRNIVHILKMI
jgi:copper homeostasis protein